VATTGADEMLIGFDARASGEDDPRWDDDRRRRFLLRRDVARPLSVDRDVWPSLADPGRGRDLSGEERERLGIGWNARLWVSLDRLRSHIEAEGVDPGDVTLVAVGWCSRIGFCDSAKGPHPAPADPARPAEGWDLLGYDVADGWQFSGLTNCGYTPAESERLGGEWAPALNRHLLLRDEDAGFAFVEVANARVPDHAPFHVFSLYRVE
jgi:hypothetical protein